MADDAADAAAALAPMAGDGEAGVAVAYSLPAEALADPQAAAVEAAVAEAIADAAVEAATVAAEAAQAAAVAAMDAVAEAAEAVADAQEEAEAVAEVAAEVAAAADVAADEDESTKRKYDEYAAAEAADAADEAALVAVTAVPVGDDADGAVVAVVESISTVVAGVVPDPSDPTATYEGGDAEELDAKRRRLEEEEGGAGVEVAAADHVAAQPDAAAVVDGSAYDTAGAYGGVLSTASHPCLPPDAPQMLGRCALSQSLGRHVISLQRIGQPQCQPSSLADVGAAYQDQLAYGQQQAAYGQGQQAVSEEQSMQQMPAAQPGQHDMQQQYYGGGISLVPETRRIEVPNSKVCNSVCDDPKGSRESQGLRHFTICSDVTGGALLCLRQVGLVIGKGGETIKYLQQASGARIQVTRDADTDPRAPNRGVELVGTQDQVARAEQLINDVINEAAAGGSGALVARGFGGLGPLGEQVSIRVPNSKVGLIIGRGGETIKNLQNRSGARIQGSLMVFDAISSIFKILQVQSDRETEPGATER
eukprot:SM001149S24275  [mRNA]  locus=s1149:40:2157:- [translate_table: standard]